MRIFKPGDQSTEAFAIVTAIGIFVLTVRLLVWTDKFHSGLLYIAVPFGLSLALYYFTPDADSTTWLKRFWNNLRLSMIILFASSLILMEGYICVVMFMPIFFFIVLIAFLACYVHNRAGNRSANSFAIPAVVILLSLEGVTELTTFDRYNEVSYSRVVKADIARIKERLSEPIELGGERHWILSVFPMPRYIGTVQVAEGEVRRYDFVYRRWIFANTHAGSLDVTFEEVGTDRIVSRIDDGSYISNYMRLRGTEFAFRPIGDGQTEVTLTIKFDRLLDPVWYFEPLQRFAVMKGAEYFLSQTLGFGTWGDQAFPRVEVDDV